MNISETITTGLPVHIRPDIQNLMALTGGHLAGIIVSDEQVLVLDWEGQNGLPYFSFSYSITFLESEKVTLTSVYHTEDIRQALPGMVSAGADGKLVCEGMEILHDNCSDIPAIFGLRQNADGTWAPEAQDGAEALSGWCYELSAKGEKLTVIAPDRWE